MWVRAKRLRQMIHLRVFHQILLYTANRPHQAQCDRVGVPPGSPSTTAQAALDGNLFFLQLYTEVGGFLDAAPHLQHDSGGCFDALSVRRFFFFNGLL